MVNQNVVEELILWIALLFVFLGDAMATGEPINLGVILIAIGAVARTYVKSRRPDIQTDGSDSA